MAMAGGAAEQRPEMFSVLIVEDESLVAMTLSCMVEDLDHGVCAVARTGASAIEEAGRHKPTVALVDIGLKGGMDGIETAAALRDLGIPSIIMSGDNSGESVERASRAGVLDFVAKPYTIERLRSALSKVVAHV